MVNNDSFSPLRAVPIASTYTGIAQISATSSMSFPITYTVSHFLFRRKSPTEAMNTTRLPAIKRYCCKVASLRPRPK